MGKPIKVLSIEQLAKWKKRALRRLKKAYNFDDEWAERRLLDVIKSHEGLRRGIQSPFTKPIVKKDARFKATNAAPQTS